jgi:hypothetical protein
VTSTSTLLCTSSQLQENGAAVAVDGIGVLVRPATRKYKRHTVLEPHPIDQLL